MAKEGKALLPIPEVNHGSVLQEFYCRTVGGGCGGYILVKMNMNLNRRIMVVCPKCNHEHERAVHNGEIIDDSRRGHGVREKFTPLMSAWSQTPRTHFMLESNPRNQNGTAAVIKHKNDVIPEEPVDPTLRQSWFDRFCKRR